MTVVEKVTDSLTNAVDGDHVGAEVIVGSAVTV
jgi:hypothetical protein